MFGRQSVDLVQSDDDGWSVLAQNAQSLLVAVAEWLRRVDKINKQIAFFKRGTYGIHHALVDGAVGLVNPGRIDEDHLGIRRREDALNLRARSLRIIGYDRNLLAHKRIQQRRFARVGASQYRDESGF